MESLLHSFAILRILPQGLGDFFKYDGIFLQLFLAKINWGKILGMLEKNLPSYVLT